MFLETGEMIGPTTAVALGDRGLDGVGAQCDEAKVRGWLRRPGRHKLVRPVAAARWSAS